MAVQRGGALVFVGTEALREQVFSCAAAAGCAVTTEREEAAVRAAWSAAGVVVLDGAGAERLAAAGFPRREGIVVVCAEDPAGSVWAAAVALGADRVAILPEEQRWLSSVLADAVERPSGTGAGKVIAVLGGRGGAGASLLACAVAARSARRGRETVLLDCDPLGGGLDVALGMETTPGMRWPDLRIAEGRIGAGALRSALPSRAVPGGRISVLACADGAPPGTAALGAVLDAGARAGSVMVCDLNRMLDPLARTALARADLTALVIPAELRACAAARMVVAEIGAAGASAQAVVRGPAPGGLRPAEVAARVGIPLLCTLRPEFALPSVVDRGQLLARKNGPLNKAALVLLAAADALETAA